MNPKRIERHLGISEDGNSMSDEQNCDTRKQMMVELIEAGVERDEIIRRVTAVLAPDDITGLVYHALNQEFLTAVRSIANEPMNRGHGFSSVTPPKRSNERVEFIAHANMFQPKNQARVERISRRAELLATGFQLRGVGFVLWGEATEAQHEARAEMLEKFGFAAFEGAQLHRRAMSEIKAAKVKTLNQIVEARRANRKMVAA